MSEFRLPWSQRLSYGVGHFFNNLTSTTWFCFLMPYLQFVLGFEATLAGWLLLLGQVSDAVATPLLGIEADSDYCRTRRFGMGRRKRLHLFGTVCILLSFPLLFVGSPGGDGVRQIAMFIYLSPLVVIFQVGWAAVQVSHLALIPDLTIQETQRDLLTIVRYGFNVVADMSVYVIAWLLLANDMSSNLIDKDDASKFMWLAVTVTCVGICTSMLFYVGVKEEEFKRCSSGNETKTETDNETQLLLPSNNFDTSRTSWLKEPMFYKVALLYTSSRVFCNFCIVFMPLYLQESLRTPQVFLAIIPLVTNGSGFLATGALKFLLKFFGKKVCFLSGVFLAISSCIWVLIESSPTFRYQGIFVVAVLLGTASSFMQVCSLSYISSLIKNSLESSAFVFSIMSFCEKLVSGLGVLVVQAMRSSWCKDCRWFYRNALGYVAGAAALIAAFCLLAISQESLAQGPVHGRIKNKESKLSELIKGNSQEFKIEEIPEARSRSC